MADSTKWWQDLPCHYHPSWNLSEISQLDLNKLKHHIDRNENDIMVAERLLYAAFLEVPIGSPYNLSRPNVVQARRYLREAEEYIEANLRDNRDASIGYGIVINACRMWIGQSTREWEEKLQILEEDKKAFPKHKHYISAVRAFALSRLGPQWLEEAKVHYEYALEGIPENSQWLYGKASMVGRLVRLKYPNAKFEKSANLPGYRDRLNEEKDILEKVLTLNKKIHIARVMYGQVLYNLGESKEAEENIEEALQAARGNRSIAEIASKYYQRTDQPEKALETLLSLPNASKTAEVHFLSGKLYKGQTYGTKEPSEKKEKWNLALNHFNETLKLDERHYPALSSRAEVHARLENYDEARKNYADLLSSNLLSNTNLQKDKFSTLKSLFSLNREVIIKEILSEEEYVNYCYEVLEIAVTKYSEGQNDKLTFFKDAKKLTEKCTSALKYMCRTQDVQIRFLAKLKLAHFHLLCRNYKEATKLYENLQAETSKFKRENIEVMWGLFRCHLGQNNYKDAARMVGKIREKDQVFYCVAELYADIYTTRAKFLFQPRECINAAEIFPEHPNEANKAVSDDLLEDENPIAIARLLENAIEMGSLEACFVFFKINKLRAHFLTSMQIPRIVAKIERVNNEEIVNTQINFQMDNDVDDTANSTKRKRNVMKDKIEELLTYNEIFEEHGKHFLRGEKFEGFNAYQEFTVINVYTKLSKLRKNLLNFEVVENRKNDNTDWSDDCEEAVTAVLLTARFLLDHIISDYQDALIEGEKPNSDFCIHYDGNIDKEGADTKLNRWLKIRFPKCDQKVPKHITDMLLKIQPMYDEGNLWLIALNTFVNTLKHGGGRGKDKKPSTTKRGKGAKNLSQPPDLLEDENKGSIARESHPVDKSVRRKTKTASTKTKKAAKNVSYEFDLLKDKNKGFLARKSCNEVEKIVLTILQEIVQIYQAVNREEDEPDTDQSEEED